MLSFKVIASFTIAIACAQLIALDAADARRGGGGGARAGGGYLYQEQGPARFLSLKLDPEKACPALDAGWTPVSRLREALA